MPSPACRTRRRRPRRWPPPGARVLPALVDGLVGRRARPRVPTGSRAGAARAAVHRPRRGHRQGLDQPARRADTSARRWSSICMPAATRSPAALNPPRGHVHGHRRDAALVTGGPRASGRHRARTRPPGRQVAVLDGAGPWRRGAKAVAAEIGVAWAWAATSATPPACGRRRSGTRRPRPGAPPDEHGRHRRRKAHRRQDGSPAPLEDFERVVRVNLIGTYNMRASRWPRW